MALSASNAEKNETAAARRRYGVTASIVECGGTRYYECHRYTSASFSYVGMERADAVQKAEALKTALTRSFYLWDLNGTEPTHQTATFCMADIAVVHAEGPLWRVDVSVDEDDIQYSDNPANSPEALNWPVDNRSELWGTSA